MSDPDRSRLTLFFGALSTLATIFVLISWVGSVSILALGPAYMFTPLAAGLAVCLRRDISLSTVGLRIGRVRWLAFAAVIALPLIGVALAFAVAVPGVGFDPSVDPVPGLELPSGVLGMLATFGLVLGLGSTVNALFAFGEEFGWRGYLLWELAPWGFWKASLAVGTVWGIWHAPIIVAGYNYPSFPFVGIGAMTIACISFSPLYTYAVVRAESVLAAALLHGVFNGSAGLIIAYAATNDAVLAELVASPVGVAGVVAFGFAAVVIALTGTPTLARTHLGGESPVSSSQPATVGDD
ncbi:CPBP family intramembrane glutamic endopeptidase [Haladaptatus sp. NG-SE-30]